MYNIAFLLAFGLFPIHPAENILTLIHTGNFQHFVENIYILKIIECTFKKNNTVTVYFFKKSSLLSLSNFFLNFK